MFDPRDLQTIEDPFDLYARLRAQGPVVQLEGGFVGVFGYVAAHEVLRDPRFTSSPLGLAFSSMLPPGALADELAHRINFLDPPDHPRVRNLVSRAFTPRRVAELQPWIRATADDLLEELDVQPDGTVELMDGFLHQLPSLVISELLGVPLADRDRLTELSDLITPVFGTAVDDADRDRAVEAAEEMHGYFGRLSDERRAAPADDLLSALTAASADGERLSEAERMSLVATLYSAGHRTTRDLVGNGLDLFLRRRHGADVDDIEGLTEELLRLATPTHYVARVPQHDVELGGVAISGWQPVLVFLAAANRDPTVYEEPDEIRVGRTGPPSLSFAFGAHSCLGAALARMEATEMLTALWRRWPGLAPADRSRRWHQRGPFRGLDELFVTVE